MHHNGAVSKWQILTQSLRCIRIDTMQGFEGEGDRSLLP